MLAAISLPPLTDDANRHAPSRQPPRQAGGRAERRADRGQREPARLRGRADRLPAQLHRQRRERHPELRRRGPGTAAPSPRAVVYGTPARAAAGRTPHAPPATCRDHRADRLGHIQPPGQHERRQQRMAHPARRAPHPAARRSSGSGPPPGHDASTPTRTPAARRTTGSPGAGTPPRRPAATYASTGSGHGHTMATGDTASDPSPRSWPNEARRDPSRSTGTAKSWPAQQAARQQHRQRARPDTRPRCSDSQAVNTSPARGSQPEGSA